MVNKRLKIKCSICERYFIAPAKSALKSSEVLCKYCKEPAAVRNQMIVIEVKEHSYLLQLYHALYHFLESKTSNNEAKLYQRLDDCNHFFLGGKKCL